MRFVVEHAEDLSAGLLCYGDRGADVALLDLGLPDSEGLDTVRQVRQRCPELALVVLTGFDDPEAALEALRQGADDYLVKGRFDEELLRRTMRHAMERKGVELVLRRETQRAQQALQARDEVLGVVSHDLRNMLATVTMATHLLMSPQLPDEKKAKHIAAIDRAGKSMRRLIDDLLDAMKLDRGPLSLERQPLQVDALLADAYRSFELVAREKGVELACAADGNPPPIWGDGERLLQVLANLIANALKFTPTGGKVTVTACNQDGVLFTVEDTGEGIEPADLPRLFERFYRGQNQSVDGVGLGLTICKGIVDAHGGTIWADSRKGQGARFCFVVPLAPLPVRET